MPRSFGQRMISNPKPPNTSKYVVPLAPKPTEEIQVCVAEADQLTREINPGSEVEIMFDALIHANIRYARAAITFYVPAYFIDIGLRK